MSLDDPYVWPGTNVLRNKLGLYDAAQLNFQERRLVLDRLAQGAPRGRFDLAHLRAIHRHLFQDVYDWAGEVRTVQIAKGGSQFQFCRFIPHGMEDIVRRLQLSDSLTGLTAVDFAAGAAEIVGDVNYCHPFRDGNGRTQLLYLEQLAEQAGHPLDLMRLRRASWIPASQAAHAGDYRLMAAAIADAIA